MELVWLPRKSKCNLQKEQLSLGLDITLSDGTERNIAAQGLAAPVFPSHFLPFLAVLITQQKFHQN